MGAAPEPRTIRLLDYDPALGQSLRSERRDEAHMSAQATLIELERGPRPGAELVAVPRPTYGLLVLEGLANRTLALDGIVSAQLVGRGDLVRAGAPPADDALVPVSSRWTVIEPLAIALLDERFLLTVRRWPEIVAALYARVAAQGERHEVHRALAQLPRVEDRVHTLLWLLAERWGRMTPHGVLLNLRLTHELIGQLVGAKRPTVSLALKELEARGGVHRRAEGGWLLLRRASDVRPPCDSEPLHDGIGLLPQGPPTPAVDAPPSGQSIGEDARRQIERMRRVHVRAQEVFADVLARSEP